ncbi:MAG: response regulator [Kiritimatiellaeota bacterium]|nr:response regulator [Kiritimatiellota bacterium]
MTRALKSLAFKLGVAVFITASLSFSGLGIYCTHLFSQQIEDRLLTQIDIPGVLMNQQTLPYNAVRDKKALSALVGEQVLFAAISRTDGTIHYATDPAKENLSIEQITDPSLTLEESAHKHAQDEKILRSFTPLYAEERHLGDLYMEIDTHKAIQKKREVSFIFFLGGLFCILTTTLVGAFLVRRLTMPRIIAANYCLKAVADGCYSVRVRQTEAEDELSTLESGINHTVQQLEERQTRDRLLTADLKNAKEAAERANRSKSEFLANMSHEIRTPMNGVLGMAQIMDGLNPTEEQRDCLDTIKGSAQSLMDIINDILDLSRIEMGNLELKDEPVCIRKLLEELHRFFTPAVAKKGLELRAKCADDVPAVVRSDEGCLRQVLVNLIANAIKFTHKGHVSVSILCPEQSDNQCALKIQVQDTGIGISEEAQEIIFKEFTQADGSHTREYGGTGLGLSICRRIIEKMGGKLKIDSKQDRGATFSFTLDLPIDRNAAAVNIQPAQSNQTPLNRAPHILVAEDNLLNQKVISKMLSKAGCEMDIVVNGKEAVDRLQLTDSSDEHGYDLVFMDIQMPVMDGLQATEIIRQNNSSIPIIALTAHAMKGDRENFIRAGMNDYLSKPIQQDELLNLLQYYTS